MPETTLPPTGNVIPAAPVTTTGTVTPVTTSPAPPREGFVQRAEGFFHRAEQGAAVINADLRTLLTDHSSQVLDVAGEALAVVKLIAPQDAAEAELVDAFLIKVLSMAQSATSIAGKALASGKTS